jgi:hypothetical protein
MIDLPALPAQHGRDPSVSVSAKPLGKANNGSGKRLFIVGDSCTVSLGGPCLAQNFAGPALGHSKLPHRLIHESLAPERA